ncbi:Arc family DNA-binding protein [Brucella sp. 2280]|uniref:Arc family DNA-binding protein n=1 Tax=Brucella sp. 2280 TaxID=2592625 RepID=UPI00129748FA|nr:Arc family DNA-binding protein [Brucella sp. 2280]QGA57243.1 Arc family DNA-binding protein [Brucella sp. 2280]
MSREDPQIKLRLPEALRDSIKAHAEANGRSMNAEIVARIEEYPELIEYKKKLHEVTAVNNTLAVERHDLLIKIAESNTELQLAHTQIKSYKRLLDDTEGRLQDERELNAELIHPSRKRRRPKKHEPLTEEEKDEIWAFLQETLRMKE